MEQAIKHVEFVTADGHYAKVSEGVSPKAGPRVVKLRLAIGVSNITFANPCDVHVCQTDRGSWLEFGDTFVWCIADDAAEQLTAFVRQYRHPVTPAA